MAIFFVEIPKPKDHSRPGFSICGSILYHFCFFTWNVIFYLEINGVDLTAILQHMCAQQMKFNLSFQYVFIIYNVKRKILINWSINHYWSKVIFINFLICFSCSPSFEVGNLSTLNPTSLSLLIASFKQLGL